MARTPVSGPATPTPFQPLPASPTPALITIWVSPDLPPPLQTAARRLSRAGEIPIGVVDTYDEAEIRLEPFGRVPLAEWMFAVAAPFPTLEDGTTLQELRAVWRGEGGPVERLLVSANTAALLRPILGELSTGQVEVLDDREISERAWGERPAWALLPFEALDPSWKVLAVDGQSPIGQGFEPEAYPLIVPLGLSGGRVDPELLASALGWPAGNRDPRRLTTVLITGVTAITRGVAWRIEASGYEYPAERIGEWLRSADFTHVSQEIAFTHDCPPPDPYQPTLRFCGDPDHFPLLQEAGVDLVELSGNHILDWGAQAFLETLDLYHGAGMATFAGGADLEEARTPARIEHNGNRIALLGCNIAGPERALASDEAPGGMPCDYEFLSATLADLRRDGYLPIFTFQWYEAYRNSPLPNQREAFRRMIDAGAAIVSGSQAHQPQGYERYGEGWIHYGLGNLFFDQMWSTATRQEMLDRYVFYDGRHLSTEVLTAYLEDFAQPRPMSAAERAVFLAEIFKASGW